MSNKIRLKGFFIALFFAMLMGLICAVIAYSTTTAYAAQSDYWDITYSNSVYENMPHQYDAVPVTFTANGTYISDIDGAPHSGHGIFIIKSMPVSFLESIQTATVHVKCPDGTTTNLVVTNKFVTNQSNPSLMLGEVFVSEAFASVGDDGLFSQTGIYRMFIAFELSSGSGKSVSFTPVYTIDFNNYVDLPADPIPATGYMFVGWYLDAQLQTPYDNRPVTEDLLLYAKFDLLQYKIAYKEVNEPHYSTKEILYTIVSQTFDIPAPTRRIGYTFLGWYTASDFSGTPVTTIVKGTHTNMTLYAKWEISAHTVTFYVNSEIYKVLEVPHGSSLRSIVVDPAFIQYELQSVSFVGEVDEQALNDEFVFLSDADVFMELKSDIDVAVDWTKNNWQIVCGSAVGFLLLVFIITLLIPRKRKYKKTRRF